MCKEQRFVVSLESATNYTKAISTKDVLSLNLRCGCSFSQSKWLLVYALVPVLLKAQTKNNCFPKDGVQVEHKRFIRS